MNAMNDPAKGNETPFDPVLDETTRRNSNEAGAVTRAAKIEAVTEALPDPITNIYGALRGLINQGETGIVVHVVAATHSEGASTIAHSIATAAAMAGSGRVLLIDGKLPNRKLIRERRQVGTDQKIASAAKSVSPGSVHDDGAVDGLFTGNISDAAQNKRVDPQDVRDAYAAWRQDYDLVVVDCPSVSSGRYIDLVPDAADWVILVVQAEKLRPAVLRKVRDTIEQQGGKILGVILNDAKRYIPDFVYRLI